MKRKILIIFTILFFSAALSFADKKVYRDDAALVDGIRDENISFTGTNQHNGMEVFYSTTSLFGDTSIDDLLVVNGVLEPAQITANQDNYNPTDLADSITLRLTTDASRDITGLMGVQEGRFFILYNVGSYNIVLKDEDASSAAAYRFSLVDGDLTLEAGQSVVLHYDSTLARWRTWAAPPEDFDSTTVDATTWSDGANASNVWTYDLSGTDFTFTAGSGMATYSLGLTAGAAGFVVDADGDTTAKSYSVAATATGGQYSFALEDTDNGANYGGFGIYGALAHDTIYAHPLAAPVAGQIKVSAAPGNQTMSDSSTQSVSVTTWGYAHYRALAVADLSDTTTPSVLTTEETINTSISNYKSSGADHVFTFPAAHINGNLIGVIGDAFQVDYEPPSGDNFILNGVAMANDEHIQNTADTKYEEIVFYVINDEGTLQWCAKTSYANFVEETP